MCFWRIYATSKRNRRPECQVPHLDMYRSIIWRLNPASLLQRWHLSKAVFGSGAVHVDESPWLGGS